MYLRILGTNPQKEFPFLETYGNVTEIKSVDGLDHDTCHISEKRPGISTIYIYAYHDHIYIFKLKPVCRYIYSIYITYINR